MALEWFGHQEAGLFGLLLLVVRDLSKKQGIKLHCKVCIQAKWPTKLALISGFSSIS